MPACSSRLGCDEDAVSEVVGYLLVFGILAMILVLSMFAFNQVQQRAEASVVEAEGQSVAQRVASAVVNAALFVEDNYDPLAPALAPTYSQPLDLPTELEGHSYSVSLSSLEVKVTVRDLGVVATAPLFSAEAPANVDFCATSATAGRVAVSFDLASGDDCIRLLEDTA